MTDDASGNGRPDSDDARSETEERTGSDDPGRERSNAHAGARRRDDAAPEESDETRSRIPIDLSRGREAAGDDEGSDVDGDEDAYGPEPRSTPIEPGSPSLENAAFVLLGAILTILVLFRLLAILGG